MHKETPSSSISKQPVLILLANNSANILKVYASLLFNLNITVIFFKIKLYTLN
jgi:hypothetical protein